VRACVPTTPLGQGALWFLFEPEDGITVTMANRAMTADEWRQFAGSEQARRKRRQRSRVDELEDEIRKDAR
jgi:hypothetical protein